MHGSFERSGKSDGSFSRRRRTGFFAFPVLLAVALIALTILEPSASRWVSQAVEAEFAGFTIAPESAPTQLAKPSMEIRTVKAY